MLQRPSPRPSSAARRQARARQRQRDGIRFYRLQIADHDMEATLDALVRYNRLTEADALDHCKIEAALAEVIADVGRKWRNRA